MSNDVIRFGPAGNSQRFYDEGYKNTVQAPQWVNALGLNAFECQFGRGVTTGEDTARKIGEAARTYGIQLSAHAPYFINFASADMTEKSIQYILDASRVMHWMGGGRVVFHTGACKGQSREVAYSLAERGVMRALAAVAEAGYNVNLCPETMGRASQLVHLDECVRLCKNDSSLIPALDFGHLHALDCGAIQGRDDYARILDTVGDGLPDRVQRFHTHFSRIEFTKAGEKQHRNYAETDYGPDFGPLAELLVERALTPVVICESKMTMADDAVTLKAIYDNLQNKANVL